jgi:hypothetical protein
MPPDQTRSHYNERTLNNRFIALGVYSSSGYDNYAPARIVNLYAHAQPTSRIEERIIAPRSLRVAELTATSIVVTDSSVLSVPSALPRVRLFTRYEVLPANQALARVLDRAFDPHTTVILDRPPERAVFPSGDPGEASIVVDQGDLIEVHVSPRVDSVLLLVDTQYPGWHAEVDGIEAPVLTANYAFRAVTVPAGAHRVVWRFRHPGLLAGVWLGAVGLAIGAALSTGIAATRRHTVRATPSPRTPTHAASP